MAYLFPFGAQVRRLVQEDQSPKKVFVLGVYASAVHARWTRDGEIVCKALAVASEPRIFWDGNPDEARAIIGIIHIPEALGTLEPAEPRFNGPSAKTLDEHILAPLGYTRSDAWLCDCLPETRLNPKQRNVIRERYNPLMEACGLNEVTIPDVPKIFCDDARADEITEELLRSQADLLVTLGDVPVEQYLRRTAHVPYASLREYCYRYGYGTETEVSIGGRSLRVLPLTHPRQIGKLGRHSDQWSDAHMAWEAAGAHA